ncbi:MAG: DEAD/DEAH box helicase-like protein [uncultured bacterium]|nr:MAG: DEAD/DEAH box helicase-like protein [uncultured bacterium]HBR71974.1 ATP-dependent helicase [Candidatus Moranbacteria bacterium]
MYNKSNARQPRANNSGWGKKFSNNSRSRGRKFTGDKIDIRRFINRAEPTKPEEVFVPENSFATLAIHEKLKQSIANRKFTHPTPIQDKAIPTILAGHDVIGLANTGTGKTAAFLIPLIHKILLNPSEKVLIVVPTRELAIQIQDEFFALAQRMYIFSVVVVGGASIHRQIMELGRRHNMVIGTPGRLKDLIERKRLDLSKFNNVVLDEADRMLDMGFINDVKLLLSLMTEKRQTMLFSATFSTEIENLVNKFLTNPQKISIVTRETSKQVDQDIVRVTGGKDKIDVLHELLKQTHFEKVLVFTRTKNGADILSKKLYQRGLKADSIHGDKPHNKRQQALKQFKENMIDILVATDVAARGLDIPNVSHVINFDIPATYSDYVHRIGRTGRADKKGVALTFVN